MIFDLMTVSTRVVNILCFYTYEKKVQRKLLPIFTPTRKIHLSLSKDFRFPFYIIEFTIVSQYLGIGIERVFFLLYVKLRIIMEVCKIIGLFNGLGNFLKK